MRTQSLQLLLLSLSIVDDPSQGFKLNTKKRFKGHLNAGYAAQISVSPDGKLVMSGDGDGHMVFWDWATTKMYKKIKAHDQVRVCLQLSSFATILCPACCPACRRRDCESALSSHPSLALWLQVCIGAAWHPLETSKVATCSWDGLIKYWD